MNKHPRRNDGFDLIGSSPWSSRVTTEKGVYKPAYSIMAHRGLGMAVLSIRGSQSIEDFLADADANSITNVELCGVKGSCHGGMYKSALWLAEEGGVSAMMKKLNDDGHEKIVFTGHSLGAGVAVLLALLTKTKYGSEMPDVSVYGYAMPACVDSGIADNVCGVGVGHVGDGVVVRSLVNKDDIVSRLSVANAIELALEIQARRDDWSPFLSSDISGVMSRAMTLWAPHQRGLAASKMEEPSSKRAKLSDSSASIDSGASTGSGTIDSGKTNDADALAEPSVVDSTDVSFKTDPFDPALTNRASFDTDGNIKDDAKLAATLLDQNMPTSRLVVPGSICHAYNCRGQTRCALVDHRHPSLRRIEAFSTCTRDHFRDAILLSLREAKARRASTCVPPPAWEPMRTDADVRCTVCSFHVSWSVTGKAATETARATHHCRACGKIVCKDCSMHKITLPRHALLSLQRVCDICYERSSFDDFQDLPNPPERWQKANDHDDDVEVDEGHETMAGEKWY